MLLIVAFLACLSGPSGQCETIELPWDGSLMQCQMFGQMAAAQWVREHDGYSVKGRLRCLNGRNA